MFSLQNGAIGETIWFQNIAPGIVEAERVPFLGVDRPAVSVIFQIVVDPPVTDRHNATVKGNDVALGDERFQIGRPAPAARMMRRGLPTKPSSSPCIPS